jgi:hypothetical protein
MLYKWHGLHELHEAYLLEADVTQIPANHENETLFMIISLNPYAFT